MTRAEIVEAFLQSKKSELTHDGGWRAPKDKAYMLFLGAIWAFYILFVFVVFFIDKNFFLGSSSGKLFLLAFFLVIVFLSIEFMQQITVYADRFVCRSWGRTRVIPFENIRMIRVSYDKNGAPVWNILQKSGESFTPSAAYVTDGAELNIFMRSAFSTLIWNDAETGEEPHVKLPLGMGNISSLFHVRDSFSNKVTLSDKLFGLVAMTLRSNGTVDEAAFNKAVDYLMAYFYLSDQNYRKRVEKNLREMITRRESNYITLCTEIREHSLLNYWGRLDFLEFLYECAYTSAGVNDNELAFLRKIAFYLMIRDWHTISIEYRFECHKTESRGEQTEHYVAVRDERIRQAYAMLNLPVNSSSEEVKRSYRQLVKTCHPDSLPSDSTSKEREQATVRFRAVTEAYDYLCEYAK